MHDRTWTRRSVLKTSLIGMLLLWDRMIVPSDVLAGRAPEGRLTFYNVHTNERLRVAYRDASGRYDRQALEDLNYLLRCHHTNQMTTMDVRVIEYVNLVQKELGGDREIHIVSGYRSAEYNELLIQRGRKAVKHSLHLYGQAIDIQIPGVRTRRIRDAALKLHYGGVGYYPRSGFIHLDSGPFRWW